MKIPKQIKIGGFDYKIFHRDRLKDDGVSTSGTHYGWFQRIYIDNTAHYQTQEESLIHEIVGAINDNYETKLEHQQISVLASCLYQVLKDNNLLK